MTATLGVYWACALKEWRIRLRYKAFWSGVVFYPLVLPAVYVLQALGFSNGSPQALAAFAHRAGTTDLVGFLYIGGAVYMWVSTMLWGPSSGLQEERLRGTLEQMFATPASRTALLYGSLPFYALQTLWMFLVVFAALGLVFRVPLTPGSVTRALAVLLLATPTLLAMGAFFAALVLRLRDIGAIAQSARGLFQVLCGMTFPIVVLPDWARQVALTLPPTYAIADIRLALLSAASLASLVPDLLVMAVMAVVLAGTALLVFRWTESSGRRTGSLAQY
jgi:ABC-2 type transport system permease protein